MIVVQKNQGDFLFQPQSEDMCWDLDVFHPTCVSANATLESLSIDFTQAALVGPAGTQIIERAFPPKKLDVQDLIDISNDIFKEATYSIKLLPTIRKTLNFNWEDLG